MDEHYVEDQEMVSDAEILRQLAAVLRQADFSTTTTTTIRQRLQIDLGVDLSEKKVFIRQHVDLYLLKQSQEQQLVERGGKEGADGGIREERGVRDQEDDECRVGGEEELDEDESRKAVKTSKIRVEPESKRMRAKIDRAIRDRFPVFSFRFSLCRIFC